MEIQAKPAEHSGQPVYHPGRDHSEKPTVDGAVPASTANPTIDAREEIEGRRTAKFRRLRSAPVDLARRTAQHNVDGETAVLRSG